MSTWHHPEGDLPMPRPGLGGLALVVIRGVALITGLMLGLALYLPLRGLEYLLVGPKRPLSSRVQQAYCRFAVWCIGVRYRIEGRAMQHPGAIVANHTSWSDIFTLCAAARIYFVSKDDVAGWPGIGAVAKLMGTVFIKRDRREAAAQAKMLQDRLELGHKLLFFPEGTSSDGLHLLPFKTTLFATFMGDELRDKVWVQPVSVIHVAPEGADPRFFGWFGEMGFGDHMIHVMSSWRRGQVRVHFHDPVRAADFADRKALAAHCQAQIAQDFTAAGFTIPAPAAK